MAGQSTDAVTDPRTTPPERGLQALADAISRGWRPYRLRAYALGIVAGILVGGIPTAIATTVVILALSLAGLAIAIGEIADATIVIVGNAGQPRNVDVLGSLFRVEVPAD